MGSKFFTAEEVYVESQNGHQSRHSWSVNVVCPVCKMSHVSIFQFPEFRGNEQNYVKVSPPVTQN